jgi:hypothetical protein
MYPLVLAKQQHFSNVMDCSAHPRCRVVRGRHISGKLTSHSLGCCHVCECECVSVCVPGKLHLLCTDWLHEDGAWSCKTRNSHSDKVCCRDCRNAKHPGMHVGAILNILHSGINWGRTLCTGRRREVVSLMAWTK